MAQKVTVLFFCVISIAVVANGARTALETQYTNHFGEKNVPGQASGPQNTYWRAATIIQNYNSTDLLKICKAAFVYLPSSSGGRSLRSESNVSTCKLELYAQLKISDLSQTIAIQVLECQPQKGQPFYLTKGRSPNSVYFVKPVAGMTKIWELDSNFSEDLSLERSFDYARKAVSLIKDNNGIDVVAGIDL